MVRPNVLNESHLPWPVSPRSIQNSLHMREMVKIQKAYIWTPLRDVFKNMWCCHNMGYDQFWHWRYLYSLVCSKCISISRFHSLVTDMSAGLMIQLMLQKCFLIWLFCSPFELLIFLICKYVAGLLSYCGRCLFREHDQSQCIGGTLMKIRKGWYN